MFLHLSVSHSIHGGFLPYTHHPPPPGRHPPGRHPPGRHLPLVRPIPLPSACWDTHPCPLRSACWVTVNKGAVCILLECILVFKGNWITMHSFSRISMMMVQFAQWLKPTLLSSNAPVNCSFTQNFIDHNFTLIYFIYRTLKSAKEKLHVVQPNQPASELQVISCFAGADPGGARGPGPPPWP